MLSALVTHVVLPALPCRACGASAVPVLGPGAGPHAARATCRQCSRFIKWLPKALANRLVLPPPAGAHFERGHACWCMLVGAYGR
jgi:hypothetical protein